MIGSIPIVDKAGKTIAELRWQGTLWSGKGKWEAAPETVKQLEDIVSNRKDLKRIGFSDMVTEGGIVKGWQGFSGWYQALSVCLPAYGLTVDDDAIIWPYSAPTKDELEPRTSRPTTA